MSCKTYRQYSLGEISDTDFATHQERCERCREAAELDRILAAQSAALETPAPSPALWDRIRSDLVAKKIVTESLPVAQDKPNPKGSPIGDWCRQFGQRILPQRILSGRILFQRTLSQRFPAWQFAAAAVVAVGLILIFTQNGQQLAPRNTSTETAMARAEAIEADYIEAIADLETLAAPLLSDTYSKLMFRYRARLETIDSQIRRCQFRLETDGANSHIRRYLQIAYQDKRETLSELLKGEHHSKHSLHQRKERGI